VIKLRPYQQTAVDKTIEWVKKSALPCIVEMSVGAGKSIYIAEVARIIHKISGGKRILCIAPRAELVTQNAAKFKALGESCSIYSASAGEKSLRHPVVFATPGTFKKVAKRMGAEFAAVIIDEGEGVTNTIRTIISDMKERSPYLRVIGTTGTPFTTNGGFVYAANEDGKIIHESLAKDPYYHKLLYRVTTRQLLDMGYLTQPIVGETGSDNYDAIHLEPNRMGKFDPKEIDKVFVGHGRKTAMIVADAVGRMNGRKAIVFFAATLDHADEIFASLNPAVSAVVSGNTKNRSEILDRFARGELRFLVNVNVLTVGWDCPSVDGIVLMRATESARLLAQIVGRALRLHEGKKDALLLDYAQNFERHNKDGDIFDYNIKAAYHSEGKVFINAECEECGANNEFSARENPDHLDIDANGYFLDLDGNRIMAEQGAIPAHYGRRCQGIIKAGREYVRCSHYWTSKECPACDHMNDITARRCENCKQELIDPNENLIANFKIQKRDPSMLQTDELLQMDVIPTVSRSGNNMVRVELMTTERSFSVFLMPDHDNDWIRSKHDKFHDATSGYQEKPRTITYKKEDSGMYDIKGYNLPTDKEILKQELLKGGYTGEV
jgi:DNA repair protein RadD